MTTAANTFTLIEQNYPATLLEADRWLLWQYLPDINPEKKPRKVPHYADGGHRTTTDTPEDAARLVDFATVKAAFEAKPGRHEGPGIALGLDTFDHLQGIDMDGIEEKGLQSLASTLPGLVEVSPSGKGLHALGIGADFQTLGSNKSGIEAYSHGRFFTCTGQVIRGQLEDLAPFVTCTLAPLHEAGKPARAAGDGAVDGFADAPTEAQVRDLRSALASMRSDDRELWVRMGLALATAGEMGRGLWIEWSQTSSLYDPADAARVWDSFRPDNTHWRNIFAVAQEAGWVNPAKRAAPGAGGKPMSVTLLGEVRAGEFVRIAEVRAALFAIKGEIPADHIAIVQGVMACCAEGQGLLAEWWAGSGLPGEVPVNPVKPRRPGALFKLAGQAYGWKGDLPVDPEGAELIDLQRNRSLKDVNARWAIANIEGKAVFVEKVPSQVFDRWEFRFSSPEAAGTIKKPQQVPVLKENEDGTAIVEWKRIYPMWDSLRNRHTFDDFSFRPVAGKVNCKTPDLPRGDILDLYTGLAIAPKAGGCARILDHVFYTWCSGDKTAFAYVIGWLARMYQRPGEQGHSAIVVKSGEGSGKNIVADMLCESWGRHGIIVSDPVKVVGQFNDHLSTSVLIYLNEALWGGDRSHEGALKRLVTDTTLEVERKYIPRFEVRNCTHLLIGSNNDWCVPVGVDDRRFFILDVNEGRVGDFAYFRELANEIANGGDAAFVHHLLNYDITGFDPRAIPRGLACASRTHADQKLRTANSIIKWWWYCLEAGFVYEAEESEGAGRMVTHTYPGDWDAQGGTLDKTEVYEAYAAWCRLHNARSESMTAWTQGLKKFGVAAGDNIRLSGSGRRRGMRVDRLPAMRGIAEKLLGGKFDS